jgi:hypothetical protein
MSSTWVANVRKQATLTAYRSAARTLQLDAVLGLNRYHAFAAGRRASPAHVGG